MRTLDDSLIKTIKNLVVQRLPDASYKAFIFGSRVTGTNRPYSDIDLGITGPDKVPGSNYSDIKQALEDSDLPFRVDVIDFASVSDKFKKQALQNMIAL